MASLTYVLVERPIRYGSNSGFKVTAALVAGMGLVALAALAIVERGGFPERAPETVRQYAAVDLIKATFFAWRKRVCFLTSKDGNGPPHFAPECAGEGRRPLVLVWGDSAAASLTPGLRLVASRRGYDVAQYTFGGCPPVLDTDALEPSCRLNNDAVLSKVGDLRPDIVILQASSWLLDDASVEQQFLHTIAEIRNRGVQKIVLVGLDVIWIDKLPANYWSYYWRENALGHEELPARTRYRLDDPGAREALDAQMGEVAAKAGVTYLSEWRVMCDPEGCLTRVGEKPEDIVTFDRHHLTISASNYLANALQVGISGRPEGRGRRVGSAKPARGRYSRPSEDGRRKHVSETRMRGALPAARRRTTRSTPTSAKSMTTRRSRRQG